MPDCPELRAVLVCLIVEDAVRPEVATARPVKRLPEIGRPARTNRLIRLLGAVAIAGEVAVEECRREPLSRNRGDGARSDPILLAARMVQRMDDAAGRDLRLV